MYIAKQSFTSVNGKTYRMGDVLSQSQYNELTPTEKKKVTKKNEEKPQHDYHDWTDEFDY